MFIELIATFVAGFAGAGVMMLVNRLTGRRLPRWLIPVAAGAAMIGVTISNEYTWFSRTSAALPEGMQIALSVEETAIYRPWTYLRPFVTRFIAVDRVSERTNDAVPDQKIVDIILYGRWSPPRKISVLFDCAAGRRADITEGVSFGEDGIIEGVVWRDTGFDDPVVRTACGEA